MNATQVNASPVNASQEFFTTLATLHQNQATGTVFGITDHDRMVVVAFANGEVKGLRFGRLTGSDVVGVLETIDIKRFTVKTECSIPPQANLPATPDLLDALSLRIPLDVLAMALKSTATESTVVVNFAAAQPQHRLRYRGQLVAAEPTPPTVPHQRPTRMYRGQIVA